MYIRMPNFFFIFTQRWENTCDFHFSMSGKSVCITVVQKGVESLLVFMKSNVCMASSANKYDNIETSKTVCVWDQLA
jgi:hypothetical protein